jgi:hypothetical protein
MKKSGLVLLIIPFIFFESCNEDFNINAPEQNIYALNCILRNDTSVQYAVISKNIFTEDGSSPSSKNINQNIKGADIKIFYNDSTFIMRDTTVQLTNSGNISSQNCYYVKNLTLQPGKIISIEAAVPDGSVLKSTIIIPAIINNYSITFPQYYQGKYVQMPIYDWSWSYDNKRIINILSYPRLEIYYKKNEDGKLIDKKTIIPVSYYSYTDENGFLIPVDMNFSFGNRCYTTLNNIDRVMQEISGDDHDKSNYIISKVIFRVTGMDKDMSKYYSAYEIFSESFTVKLRPTDYSNIEGGKGIFGVYFSFTQQLFVDKSYIESFGYR